MTEKTEEATIARNAWTSYALRILLGASALLVTPYLYRRLGHEGFGTWSVMFTLATIFELLESGFSAGVVKLVSEFRGQGRRRDLQATVGVAVALMGGLGLLALVLSGAAGWLLAGLAAPSERDEFRTGMLVLGAAMLVRYPCVAYAATLKGSQRYDLYNASQAALVAGLSLGSVVAVEAGTGVLGLAVAYASALVGGGVLFAVLLARFDPQLSLRPRLGDGRERGRIVAFSSYVLLADSMVYVGQRMDVVVIAAVRNAATAAPYAAALKLQSALQALTLPFMNLLMPMVSELWARGDRDEVVRRLAIATRVGLQLTLPVAFALVVFSSDLIGLWLGPTAPEVTAAIVAVLAAVQTVTLSTAPAEKVLMGIGRVRMIGGLAFVEGVSNLGLSVLLVSAYGAVGAAIGTLCTSALLAPVRFPLVCRATGCSLARLLGTSVVPAVASSLPGLAAMLAVWAWLPEGPARLALGVALGLGLSAAVAVTQLGPARMAAAVRTRRARIPAPTLEPQPAEIPLRSAR